MVYHVRLGGSLPTRAWQSALDIGWVLPVHWSEEDVEIVLDSITCSNISLYSLCFCKYLHRKPYSSPSRPRPLYPQTGKSPNKTAVVGVAVGIRKQHDEVRRLGTGFGIEGGLKLQQYRYCRSGGWCCLLFALFAAVGGEFRGLLFRVLWGRFAGCGRLFGSFSFSHWFWWVGMRLALLA